MNIADAYSVLSLIDKGFTGGSEGLPAMWETRVQSLGWEDPLEKKMATHSGILAWETPVDRGAWKATVHRVAKSWTRLSDFTFFLLMICKKS